MRSGWTLGRRGAVALLTVVVALVGGAAAPAGAQSSSQLAKEIDQVQNEIDRLDAEVGQLEEDQLAAQDELTQVQADIQQANVRIAELEQQLGTVQSEVSDLAVSTFVSGDQIGGLGSLLTGSGDVTDSVEREQYAKLALSAGQTTTDQLDATVHELDNERQVLAGKQAKAQKLIEQIDARQKSLTNKSDDFANYKKSVEAKYGQALIDEQKRRNEQLIVQAKAAEAAARAAASARAAAAATAGNSGTSNGGGTARGGGNPGGGSSGGSSGAGSVGRNVPPPSPGAGGAVAAAMSQRGVPYHFATSSPGNGFDCSGLTAWAWEQAGVSLPHQSRQQFAVITHIDPSEVQPGDLIFTHNPISHVGMYIGGGQMIHAPHTGDVVRVIGINWSHVTGVGRP